MITFDKEGKVVGDNLKLHLGAYKRRLHDFINIDIRPETNPDLVDDAFKLEKIRNESCSLIYSSHVLEHNTRQSARKALQRWFEVLKPGGICRVSVPDIGKCCKHYVLYENLRLLQCFFWGSQNDGNDVDWHLVGWDKKTLTEDLESVGFDSVEEWSWEYTDPHFYIDDYSQAYLLGAERTMDKFNPASIHMSLNLQATKRRS